MSKGPGRNDPCPCGSGKKYKRCCLPRDQALAHQAQQELFADEDFDVWDVDEDAFDDEDWDELEDEDAFLLDVATIRRVCYTHGFVERLSDMRKGRGLDVTEWETPHIPQSVLGSIAREELDVFEGSWGDPKAGTPIQVDVIDLETDDAVFSIEIFNRAICLGLTSSEEIQRIHRACEALKSAASARPAEPTDTTQVVREAAVPASGAAATASDEAPPPEPRVELANVLKQHRKQLGTCALCGETLSRTAVARHFVDCGPAHDISSAAEGRLVHLRVTAPGDPAYWLDVEAKTEATLDALDAFLRKIWLECCGHLSMFRIGAVRYFSRGYELGGGRSLGPLASLGGKAPAERRMSARLRDVLPSVGERFNHEYDFGSTTELQIRVIGERTGRIGRSRVRVLARNMPVIWPCAICGAPATVICAFCRDGGGNPFVCDKHRRRHACGEDEGCLPVVNSPRMGVCGYTGET